MNRMLLTLALASTCLILAGAQIMCNVGESDVKTGGQCNNKENDAAKGDAACKAECTKMYGAEVIKSACSAPRPNKERECICSLKCANGGCWGDPHCHSFDNTQFGYQALNKYYVFKPLRIYKTLPNFEIIQSNHFWGAGPYAVLDTVNFVVPEFAKILEIVAPKVAGGPWVFTVNKVPQNIPWRYSDIDGHQEDFINVNFASPDKRSNLIVETSFGVRITISSIPHAGVGAMSVYNDISVDIPRHPELKGNTGGIFGRWNDNPADDNIDANGKAQPLDAAFSHAFGNSWLVPGSALPSQCQMDLAKRLHEDHVRDFNAASNKAEKDRLTKLCKDNLDNQDVNRCLRILDKPPIKIDNCVLDLAHITDKEQQNKFVQAMLTKFLHHCPNHDQIVFHHDEGGKTSKIPVDVKKFTHVHHRAPDFKVKVHPTNRFVKNHHPQKHIILG